MTCDNEEGSCCWYKNHGMTDAPQCSMNFEDIDPLLERLPSPFAGRLLQWFIQLRAATVEGDEQEAVELSRAPPPAPPSLNANQLAAHATLMQIFLREIVALQQGGMGTSAGVSSRCCRCGKDFLIR